MDLGVLSEAVLAFLLAVTLSLFRSQPALAPVSVASAAGHELEDSRGCVAKPKSLLWSSNWHARPNHHRISQDHKPYQDPSYRVHIVRGRGTIPDTVDR